MKLRAVLAALTLALATAAPAAARGGGGTVTALRVGPLEFDFTTSTQVLNWAGGADHVYYMDRIGSRVRLNTGKASYAVMEYFYPGGGYTDYGFYWDGSDWIFTQFDTTLKRFHTLRGTKVGMTYAQAKRREHRPYRGECIDVGLWRIQHKGGEAYSMVVGVDRGRRVHALHAFGPNPLPC